MLRMMPGITGRQTASVAMSRERVLVVDDEQDLLELVSYNLNKEGFRVVGVASGEEALSAFMADCSGKNNSGCCCINTIFRLLYDLVFKR